MAKCAANYGPLTPITFLERTAALYPERTSIIYGDLQWTWAQTFDRCRRLASKVSQLVDVGQTVSSLLFFFPFSQILHLGFHSSNQISLIVVRISKRL